MLPERRTQTYFEYFDTVSQVIGYEDDEQEFDRICGIVSEMLDKYHRLSDIYHRYDGINNLYTINHAAGEEPVEVDEELIDMLLIASEMAEVTDGYFDISTEAFSRYGMIAARKRRTTRRTRIFPRRRSCRGQAFTPEWTR